MSFKDLDPSKIKISDPKPKGINNNYKGNVCFTVEITDHVLERFAQRFLNGSHFNFSQIRQYIQDLIYEQGIIGYEEGSKSYIAVPKKGLFIVQNLNAVTFIGLQDINPYYKNLYIKLLEKGRVD